MPKLDKDVETDAEVDVDDASNNSNDKKKDRKKLKKFKSFDSDSKTIDGGKKKVAFTEIDPEKYIELEPNTSDSDAEKNKESGAGASKEKVQKVKSEAVNGDKKIVITFGRMNPPTTGHEKLVRALNKTAKRVGGEAAIYLSHSQDAKKNPLSYKDKLIWAQKAFGDVVKKSSARNIIEVLKELDSAYTDVTIVVGSDRVKEFDTLANKYNGKEYNFKSIQTVTAGERDPDSEGVDGMSASKMRELAKDGKISNFLMGLPNKLAINQKSSKALYTLTRKGMGIREATDHVNRAKSAIEREKASDKAKHDRMLDRARILATRDQNKMTEENLDEALSRAARRKRGLLMKRLAKRIAMRRKIMMRKKADIGRLKMRAHKKALLKVKHIVAGKRDYNTLSIDQKMKIDDKAKTKKGLIDRLAKRLLPQVKQAEKERMQRRMVREEKVNEAIPLAAPLVGLAARGVAKTAGRYLAKKATKAVAKKVAKRVAVGAAGAVGQAAAAAAIPAAAAAYTAKKAKDKLDGNKEKKESVREIITQEGYLGAKGEKGRDYRNAGTFDKDTAYSHAKKHNGVVHKDPSGKYLVKHGRGKHVSEENLNKSYHKGLSKSTQSKRQAQFDKQAKMSDNNPAAYKPAPGDATAKTKTSKHTKTFAKMFGEAKTPLDKKVESKRKQEETQLKRPHQALTKENQVKFDGRFSQFKKWKNVPASQVHEELNDLIEQVDFIFESNPKAALQNKAEKTGISYSILKQVFDRGVAAWKTGHRPGTTPAQWGLARVNSFATKSSGTWGKADKDLAAKVRKEEVSIESTTNEISDFKRREIEYELRNEPDELRFGRRRTSRTSYRPRSKQTHTVHINGKPWKKADNERHAQAILKTLQKKGVDSKVVVTNEEGGAGEWGTNKLVRKYKKDTPGEK